jgi:hypothetical protein
MLRFLSPRSQRRRNHREGAKVPFLYKLMYVPFLFPEHIYVCPFIQASFVVNTSPRHVNPMKEISSKAVSTNFPCTLQFEIWANVLY